MKRWMLGAAGVAAATLAGITALAVPSGGVAAPAPVVVYGRSVSQTSPLCPPQAPPGGQFTRAEHLYTGVGATGNLVGYTSEVAIATSRLPGEPCGVFGEALFTLRLPKGTITAAGLYYPDNGGNTLAVTGGTNGYSGASGQLDVTQFRAYTRLTVTLR